MKRKLPTVLILLVMVLIGAMYWVDLSYYTNPATGFVTQGAIWMRYIVLLLPALMAVLGLRTVGPRAIAVLRVRNKGLAALFVAAAAIGIAFGVTQILFSFVPFSLYRLAMGLLFIWYGVWMFLVALQLFVQNAASPTRSAIWGVLAALPFCALTVYRVMIRPSSLYRISPLVSAFAALLAMLWFGMLLRSLYIAMPQSRMRWMYILGLFTFLFCTCLEFPQAIHYAMFQQAEPLALLESLNMALLGLVAGCVSVACAAQDAPTPSPEGEPLKN